jgi:hypothetical protein
VDRVPDPLLFRKSGSAGNRTRTSGSVAKNSDYLTTEAVLSLFMLMQNAELLLFAQHTVRYRKVACSIPIKVLDFFNLPNPSSRAMARVELSL